MILKFKEEDSSIILTLENRKEAAILNSLIDYGLYEAHHWWGNDRYVEEQELGKKICNQLNILLNT